MSSYIYIYTHHTERSPWSVVFPFPKVTSPGDAVKASEVLSTMAQRRLVPNQHVYGAAIHACNRSRDAVSWDDLGIS